MSKSMINRSGLISAMLTSLVIGLPSASFAQAMLVGDETKGQGYAEQKCVSCHIDRFGGDGNEIYTRDNHRVKTIEGLMQQVQFCSANTGAGFSEEQQDDIIAYLNGSFYHYGDE